MPLPVTILISLEVTHSLPDFILENLRVKQRCQSSPSKALIKLKVQVFELDLNKYKIKRVVLARSFCAKKRRKCRGFDGRFLFATDYFIFILFLSVSTHGRGGLFFF